MTRIQAAVSLLTRATAWTEQEYREGGTRKPLSLAAVTALAVTAGQGRPATPKEMLPFAAPKRRESTLKNLLEYGYMHLHGHDPQTYALTTKGNEFVNTILK